MTGIFRKLCNTEYLWAAMVKRLRLRRLDLKVAGSNPLRSGQISHLGILCCLWSLILKMKYTCFVSKKSNDRSWKTVRWMLTNKPVTCITGCRLITLLNLLIGGLFHCELVTDTTKCVAWCKFYFAWAASSNLWWNTELLFSETSVVLQKKKIGNLLILFWTSRTAGLFLIILTMIHF